MQNGYPIVVSPAYFPQSASEVGFSSAITFSEKVALIVLAFSFLGGSWMLEFLASALLVLVVKRK